MPLTKYIHTAVFILLLHTSYAQQVAHASACNIVTSPATKIVLQGGITFSNASSLKDSGDIYVQHNAAAGRENWADNVVGGVFNAASHGTVHFVSSQLQDITGAENFYNLQVAGDSGINVLKNIYVKNNLLLDTGMVYLPNASTVAVANAALNAVQSTSGFGRSYVLGKLARATNIAGSEYLFPIGKITATDSLYAPVKIEKTNSTLVKYTGEYFPQLPTDNLNVVDPYILSISNVEYWQVSSDGAASNDDAWLSLSYRPYSQVPATASGRDSLLVAHYIAGPQWSSETTFPNPTIVTGNASFGYVRSGIVVNNINPAFPYFTLSAMNPAFTLPLQLIHFTATKAADKNILQWTVNTNEDARLFEVLKSTDGMAFYPLGKLAATNKNGMDNYNLPDMKPDAGWNYYQLKTTSKNGKISYSAVQNIYIDNKLSNIKLYPNPAHDIINIALSSQGNYSLTLLNAAGQFISQRNASGTLVQINIAQLAAGNYYMQVVNGGSRQVLPFVKLK